MSESWFPRGVNESEDPYYESEENQSTVEVVLLSENRVEPMLAPESSEGINQEIDGNRGCYDVGYDRGVDSRDGPLEQGHTTCDEESVDAGELVVEYVLHAMWGVEYEGSWRVVNIDGTRHRFIDTCVTHSNRIL